MNFHLVEFPSDLQENIIARLQFLRASIKQQDSEVQELFGIFCDDLMADDDIDYSFTDVLFNTLDKADVLCMKDMLAGAVGRFSRFILSGNCYQMFEAFLEVKEQCALSLCAQAVPAGGRRPLVHINGIESALEDFFVLDVLGMDDDFILSLLTLITDDDETYYIPPTAYIASEWLAVKITRGDEKIIRSVKDKLEHDDDRDLLGCLFITPIFMSGNHALISVLLRAIIYGGTFSDIDEGVIFESHQGISIESWKYLFDVIHSDPEYWEVLEPQLRRLFFPKVDLGVAHESDVYSLATECLESADRKKEMISSNDALKVYAALWAEGFADTDTAWNLSNYLVKDGNPQCIRAVNTYYKNHWTQEPLKVLVQRYPDLIVP